MMTLLLIAWGSWSVTQLSIDAVPDITNNQVQIFTACPTLAGQEVEQLVTFPIEQSIANLPDLIETRSISRFGLSVVTLVFDDDVDIYFARQLVFEKLKEAEAHIPQNIGVPELAPVSTGLGEVYQYILHPKKGSEDKYNAKDLRTMQDWIVARQLNGTKGIAEVNSFGGELKQYEVSVDPNRLRAMGVSISDIFTALEKNNQNTGGAYIDKKPNAYFIRGVGIVTSIEDVENIAVKTIDGSIPIFIKDVAVVRFGSAVRYGAMTYNGEVDAVGGVVMMLKGANSNDVVKRVKAKIPIIQKSLPEDVIIEAYLDRTDLVGRAISTVEKNLIEGALIVIFVLVIFLGNFRAGLIVASAIPLSMLFALGLMNVFGVSANLMSLGAIDFGLIVDGAVIIVEATLHHLGLRKSIVRMTQQEMDEEVFASASKIRNSAAFGEIIILIVYIPILTLVGIEGKMFTPMAKTVGFAIIGALILSLTYIPMMCALFLSKNTSTKVTFSDKMMNFFQRIYQPMLQMAIKLKYVFIGLTVAVFVVSLLVFRNLGGEFIPQLQEGDFAFHCILPQGSSLSQSIETSMQASRIIKQFDEVKMVVGKTGSAEVPTDPMPPEATDLMVILKPQKDWKNNKSYEALGNEINESLEVIPGVFFEKNQPIQMRFNELMTGIRQDVAVKIFGENLDSLSFYANKVSSVIQSVEGATSPQVEKVIGLPQINIEYDRTRLANYGINVEDVNNVVSAAFAGKTAGQVYENERRFDLVVRLDSAHRTDIDDVSNLTIPTSSGNQIPISQIARVTYKQGPAQISREDSKRRIVIGFNVSGRDVQSVVEEIQNKLNAQIKLPSAYYFTYGGQFENLQKASQRLMIAVPISLILIFVLLYFTFNSIKQAGLIFTAIPMSAIGGIFALLIRGMPFSISAGIGFIALFGVSVLNGIVLIGTFNQLEKEGITDIIERVKQGTKERLRPVLMTATVASLGFLPMALSTGAGAEVQKPLATVVIGGLLSATILTLFVLPLFYMLFTSSTKIKTNFQMKSTIILTILLASCLQYSALGQSSTALSLEETINIALQNNGSLISRHLEIEAAKSLSNTAFELPKLDINAQLGQYNSTRFDQGIQVSQTMPFPTLFTAKKELMIATVKGKELQSEVYQLELKTQVRSLYYQIQYLEHNQQLLMQMDSLYDDFIKVAELRYSTGESRKIEISTALAKKGEINLLVNQNQVDKRKAYSNLEAMVGNNKSIEIIIEDNFAPLEISRIYDSTLVELHPFLKSIAQDAEIIERSKKVDKAQAKPDFTLAYNNQSLIGFQTIDGQEKFFGSGKRFSFVSIGIAIPLTMAPTRARIQSLDYQKQAVDAKLEYQQNLVHLQLKNLMAQYQQELLEYDYYQKTALPLSEEVIASARFSYSTGESSYLEYLYALQSAADTKLAFLNSIHKINQSVIHIYSLFNQ